MAVTKWSINFDEIGAPFSPLPLEHHPEKACSDFEPGVETSFSEKSCSAKQLELDDGSHPASGGSYCFGMPA
jgi:hypothetical protein